MRKTVPDIINSIRNSKNKIAVLTASTAPIAKALDGHADILLVGDSLGMVLYGMSSTLQVTTDMMINHGKAVVRSSKKSLVVVDLPFGSYQESPAQALRTAAKIIAKTKCQAVKLEGGQEFAATVKLLVASGIPVMGHIGLLPQSFNNYGGFKIQGRDKKSADKILGDAIALEKAGCFAIVIEGVKENLAAKISAKLKIPTIGIGASAKCGGQVLVAEDILGLTENPPKFVKRYANLLPEVSAAAKKYCAEVKSCKFPTPENLY